jgi:hypothetical protein
MEQSISRRSLDSDIVYEPFFKKQNMNLLYGKSGSCLLRQPCGRTMSGLTLDSRKLNSNGQCRERQNRNKKYREQYFFIIRME